MAPFAAYFLALSSLLCMLVGKTNAFANPRYFKANFGAHNVRESALNLLRNKSNGADREALNGALSTYLAKYENQKCNRGEKVLSSTFQEMCKVYGAENASILVETEPKVLNYSLNNFGPTFEIYAEKFGRDESMAMLIRNPNLLAIRPTGPGNASEADDSTMYMSYVVAATRPGGKYLLGSLLALLAVPSIEIITGLNIRGNLFASLFGS